MGFGPDPPSSGVEGRSQVGKVTTKKCFFSVGPENTGNFNHMISTGSTLANLAISGGRVRGGGLPGGIFVEIYGPESSGKTTLARLVAKSTKSRFIAFSAVTSGVKEVREIVHEASERRKLHNQRTVLFVDEIHRFNKAQQDAFLPAVIYFDWSGNYDIDEPGSNC